MPLHQELLWAGNIFRTGEPDSSFTLDSVRQSASLWRDARTLEQEWDKACGPAHIVLVRFAKSRDERRFLD
jgi:hypothetical protein